MRRVAMGKPQEALGLFEKGFNCAQSVLGALGPDAGLDKEIGLGMAGSFGGGMARRGETCGAVTGALMVLGLRHAMVREEDAQAKNKNYAEAEKFMEDFKK